MGTHGTSLSSANHPLTILFARLPARHFYLHAVKQVVMSQLSGLKSIRQVVEPSSVALRLFIFNVMSIHPIPPSAGVYALTDRTYLNLFK